VKDRINFLDKFPPSILVLVAVLLWSTGGLFIKLTTLSASQVTFFRSLLAAVTVALFTFRNGLGINLPGIFTSIIYATLLFLFVWATKHTTAANAIFLQYTAPIYIVLFAPFLIGEKFRWSDLVSVLVCLGGMSLFFVGQLRLQDYQGNFAALGSGLFLGLYIMLLRHPRLRETNQAITVIYGNLLLVLINLPAGISALSTITSSDLLYVGFLGVFQIGISYILFIRGVVNGVRPLDASLIGFLEPILNPIWVLLFVGERPSRWATIGGIIIVAAVAFHTFRQNRILRNAKPSIV